MDSLIDRSEFGVLARNDAVYLDSAATSLMPKRVIGKISEYYNEWGGSPGRGVYRAAARAWRLIEDAREVAAAFLNCDVDEVVFVKNTTDGINLVAQGLPWSPGDRIVVTIFEHHSNLLPWLRLAHKNGITVLTISPTATGDWLGPLRKTLAGGGVKLVACTQTSNVLGVTLPVAAMGAAVHAAGAWFLVDGAQAAPHGAADVRTVDADFYALSGHKALGPQGAGVLVVRRRMWDAFEPARVGGGVVADMDENEYRLTPPPTCYEAGTYDVAAIAGLAEAFRILGELGKSNLAAHDREWALNVREALRALESVKVYGDDDNAGGTCSFNVAGISPHRAAILYEQWGNVSVRSGHHCALPLIKKHLGVPQGTIRASAYLYNDSRDFDRFLSTTSRIVAQAKK